MPACFLQFNRKEKKKISCLKTWPLYILSGSSLYVHVYKTHLSSEQGQMNELKTAKWEYSCSLRYQCILSGRRLRRPPSSVTGLTDVQTVMKPGKECGNKHWLYYNWSVQNHFSLPFVLWAPVHNVWWIHHFQITDLELIYWFHWWFTLSNQIKGVVWKWARVG